MKSRVQVPLPQLPVVQSDTASNRQISEFVTRYGYDVIATGVDWLEAASWIEANPPDAAILELVSDGDSLNLARSLVRIGVPLLFYTSRESIRAMPVDLRGMPCLEKPEQFNLLLKPLARMLSERFVQRLRDMEVLA